MGPRVRGDDVKITPKHLLPAFAGTTVVASQVASPGTLTCPLRKT
jgi:hypothetical protein